MRYIVRTTPSQARWIDYLNNHISNLEVCMDTEQCAMHTWNKSLAMAGDDPHVNLEDDIILTNNFVEKIEAVIAERPNEVIQFFSMRQKDITVGSRYDNSYLMAQCTYYPAGYAPQILSYEWALLEQEPTGLDLLVCHWLRSRKEKYWIHCPSLVEHRIAKSRIDTRRSSKRQSKTFQR